MRRKRSVEVCVVAWIDLLGYGSQLRRARFDPSSPHAAVAVRRLREFHDQLRDHASTWCPIFPMNDGAVLFRDAPWGTRETTGYFLRRVVSLHRRINAHDRRLGFPGARTVLAAGHRSRHPQAMIKMEPGKLERIVDRQARGHATVRTAVTQAFNARPVYGYVPELQANFAFTKAFVAEHAGSRIGLTGNRLYVDTALFDGEPAWVGLGERHWLRWKTMAAEFAEVHDFAPKDACAASWAGLRTGSEIDAGLAALEPPAIGRYALGCLRHVVSAELAKRRRPAL